MTDEKAPNEGQRKINEALVILQALGMPQIPVIRRLGRFFGSLCTSSLKPG